MIQTNAASGLAGRGHTEDGRKGEEVTLSWTVHPNQIQEGADVWITLESDSQYHRHGEFDDRFHLAYHVLPPLDADLGSPGE